MTAPGPNDAIARRLVVIAREAGNLLLDLRNTPPEISRKSDNTPTCAADTDSEALIVARLRAAFAAIPIVSEERVKDESAGGRFFLVDPLDGTADFIDGGSEFCVNIALIENGRPIAAVIHAPVQGTSWFAGETVHRLSPGDAGQNPISARRLPAGEPLIALTSNRYGDKETEACLDAFPSVRRRRISSAVKFCLIAEGAADLYIRHGRTMEWDTAAGALILTRAGGAVTGIDGAPLTYGQASAGYANPAFIAAGDPALIPSVIAACRTAFQPS